jgi:hypothetical protein
VNISSLAYVDNTVWIARSKGHASRMLDLAMEFFHLNDIAVNAKKTVLMVVNPTADPWQNPLTFGLPALPLLPIPKSEGTRYLGCHISPDGRMKTQRQLINELVTGFVNQLLPKQITDFQAVYLINHVLIPSILARCIIMVPSHQECLQWTRQYLKVVKQKSHLPRDTPNVMLFHPCLYKLTDLYDVMSTTHISELWLHLNSPSSSLAGEVSRLRLLSLHQQRMTMESPVSNPTSEVVRHGSNLIARILPLMAERNVKFDIPSGWGSVQIGQVGISTLFSDWVEFRPIRSKLRHHGLFAVEQLLSPDCKYLLSWKELCNHIPSLPYAVPQWFTNIEATLGIARGFNHRCPIMLPPSAHPAVPNPFYNSQLPFLPIAAGIGNFVVVFPASFQEDGSFYLAKLLGWERALGENDIRYHLQHWRLAEDQDDPGGQFSEGGYYVQCDGDCEAPQPCGMCGVGCCWVESAGVVNVAYDTWEGWIWQVNFLGEEIEARQFVSLELTQAEVSHLWSQLPDEPGECDDVTLVQGTGSQQPQQPLGKGEGIGPHAVLSASPALSPLLALICPGPDSSSSAWLQLQGLSEMELQPGSLAVYTDGSLQAAGSTGCSGGAGVVVMVEDKSIYELGVQLGGWMSSTKSEIYACIAALAAVPPSQAVHIYTDSQGLLAGYEMFVSKAAQQPFRRLLRTRFY